MKLEIEIFGRMFQDCWNELYRWDTDNYLKISLGEKLIYSGQLDDLTVVDADDTLDAATETIKGLSSYNFDSMKRCSFQTKEGKTERFAYAYCNLEETGTVTIQYGKFHLQRVIEVADDFKLSDLTFVRLDNLARSINSGDAYFASLICCPGHGEISLSQKDYDIKERYKREIW